MRKLEKIRLPPNTKLFTSDAVSMYTNIETEHGLDIMNKWLVKLEEEGKIAVCEFSRDLMINLLKIGNKKQHVPVWRYLLFAT